MKKIALFCLWLSLFLCYMEWGMWQSAFVFEIAYQLLFQVGDKANAFGHPLIVAPFFGQLLILFALFAKQPKKWMVWTGIALMGLLVLMVLVAGLFSLHAWMVISTFPFILSAIWSVGVLRKKA
jgi:hypothetical protein